MTVVVLLSLEPTTMVPGGKSATLEEVEFVLLKMVPPGRHTPAPAICCRIADDSPGFITPRRLTSVTGILLTQLVIKVPIDVPGALVPVGASSREPRSRTPAGTESTAGMMPMRPKRPSRPSRPSRPGLLGTTTVGSSEGVGMFTFVMPAAESHVGQVCKVQFG